MAHIEWPQAAWPWTQPQSGWQCPSCHRVYSPSMVMCSYCPAGSVTGTSTSFGDPPGTTSTVSIGTTNHQPAVDFIAKGHLGTPCPRPEEGGTCGCDEDDDAPPKVCLKMHCDH